MKLEKAKQILQDQERMIGELKLRAELRKEVEKERALTDSPQRHELTESTQIFLPAIPSTNILPKAQGARDNRNQSRYEQQSMQSPSSPGRLTLGNGTEVESLKSQP